MKTAWIWRFVPSMDDALLVLGAVGASVAVGGLAGPLFGLLLLSVLALAGGVLLGRAGGAK